VIISAILNTFNQLTSVCRFPEQLKVANISWLQTFLLGFSVYAPSLCRSFSGAKLDLYYVNSLKGGVYLKSICGTDSDQSFAIIICCSHCVRCEINFQQRRIWTLIFCQIVVISNCQSRQWQSPRYGFFVAVMNTTAVQINQNVYAVDLTPCD